MTTADLTSLAATLAEIAVRNTAAVVTSRISAVRARKLDQEAMSEMVELVNDLIADKAELVSIARAFEQELVAQRISSDDITYITTQLLPVLEKLLGASTGGIDQEAREQIDLAKSLLSPEMLTIMQLVGFNYRRAIGEPLTQLVERLILSRVPTPDASLELEALRLRQQAAYFEALNSPEARRFLENS